MQLAFPPVASQDTFLIKNRGIPHKTIVFSSFIPQLLSPV